MNRAVVLLIGNFFGAILYVFAASRGGWAIPAERAAGIYVTTAEPMIWAMHILPIVAIFLLINLAWAIKIAKGRDWSAGRLWLLSAALWVVAVVIDFAHH
jgi:hypothetical protein